MGLVLKMKNIACLSILLIWIIAYSLQGKVDTFTSRVGERMVRPSFSPPW